MLAGKAVGLKADIPSSISTSGKGGLWGVLYFGVSRMFMREGKKVDKEGKRKGTVKANQELKHNSY